MSSRQITYSVVLRTIENRINEVIQDTLVMPNMDDTAFYPTTAQVFPGGIWKEQSTAPRSSLYDDTEHLPDSEDPVVITKSDVDDKPEAKVHRRMKTTLRKTPSIAASDILPLNTGRPTRSASFSSVQSDSVKAEKIAPSASVKLKNKKASERSMANVAAVHVFRSDTFQTSPTSLPSPIGSGNSTSSSNPTQPVSAALSNDTIQDNGTDANNGNEVQRTAQNLNSSKDKDLYVEKLLSPSLATVSATKDAVKRWGANYMAKRQGKDISRQAVAASLKRDRENKLVNSQKPNTHQPGDEVVLPRGNAEEDDPDNGPMAFHRSSQTDSGQATVAPYPAYAASMMTIPGVPSIAQIDDTGERSTFNMSRRKPVPSQQQAMSDDVQSSSSDDPVVEAANNVLDAVEDTDASAIEKERHLEQAIIARRTFTNDSIDENGYRGSTDPTASVWQEEDPDQSSLKDGAEHMSLQY